MRIITVEERVKIQDEALSAAAYPLYKFIKNHYSDNTANKELLMAAKGHLDNAINFIIYSVELEMMGQNKIPFSLSQLLSKSLELEKK